VKIAAGFGLSLATQWATAATIDVQVAFERAAPPAVLVWMAEDTSWKPTTPTVVDQRFEAFHPLIAVAAPGGTVRITNSDTQQHNVFALDPERHIDLDLGLGAPGSELSLAVTWPAGGVVRHGCKIHPQMALWVAALTSAYHATSEIPEGELRTTLRLTDVPDGLTRVAVWAPRIEPLELAPGTAEVRRKGKVVGSVSVQRLP
jgi:plastocyanin